MMSKYELLQHTYRELGYEIALQFIDGQSDISALTLTNFYCYLTIQQGYKPEDIRSILEECLLEEQCKGAERALTKYHLAQCCFINDHQNCIRICQEIVNQFLGQFYALKIRLDRGRADDQKMFSLGHILHYCFLLLAHASHQQHRYQQSAGYSKAARKISPAPSQLHTAFQVDTFQQHVKDTNTNALSSEKPEQSDDKYCIK